MDWQAIFFDPGLRLPARLLERARHRYGDGPEADAAYNFAFDAVSDNEWAHLRDKYRGRGKPEAFLCITFCNLLQDYGVHKYGRRRPPVWVQRLGRVWSSIYRMLCLQRMPSETIVDHLTARGDVRPAEVRQAISQVRGRIPDCGQYTGEYLANETVPESVSQRTASAELEQSDLVCVIGVLKALLTDSASTQLDEGDDTRATAAAIHQQKDALRKALSIDDEERLLLKLIYQDAMPVARAARILKLPERRAGRMHQRLLQRLSDALAPYSIDARALADVAEGGGG